MSGEDLKSRIQAAVKEALKGRDQERLITLRMILAGIKQREVDERVTLDDAAVLGVIEKMIKQRRESADEYRKAARPDLADKEQREIEILRSFLPVAMADDELEAAISGAIAETGAVSMKDLSKVMTLLRGKLVGRADMGRVSAIAKSKLGG